MLDDLYSARLLSLSANIPNLGRLDAPQGSSTRHARMCGSVVTVDVVLNSDGLVCEFAQDVKACALGQASAAVLGEGVMGASPKEVSQARDGLRSLLAGEDVAFGDRFADLSIFEAVRDYKARHASVMLAFEATAQAMEQALEEAPASQAEPVS
ncbi:MAG: iron-sulfur cluster assembly scaffold protein [Rhizobiales bacterium]|nr:iron-sulfur cluster assembly scaffold protein [Hyphomicrobiales bacterium]MBO6697832.1 iron-sulfur cluster assembly scaffold protein [Hyphomicrobiales bacterium]MBO6735913.1 iron-sulfur cluster assembly scaffold protein [Hyphomicrobiales bacterium]MBO6912383.1 iron-sulfur cluster assembly scaffold protein [Hyphomicrobiales bacterium]MBO6955013.1 iron-sulfur cluster assembly scaffold protein [Hyphomicrobiales bacterium]